MTYQCRVSNPSGAAIIQTQPSRARAYAWIKRALTTPGMTQGIVKRGFKVVRVFSKGATDKR